MKKVEEELIIIIVRSCHFKVWQLIALLLIIIIAIFVLGGCTGYFLKTVIRKKVRIIIRKLDNIVLFLSSIGAVFCLVLGVCGIETKVSIQILSFYTSFIFSWLLTKKSAKEEFGNMQHKVAKSTYRHIEDIEVAALVTQDRLFEIKEKKNITGEDVEGVLDNVEIILTGIKSNKEDWKDWLKSSYIKKIEGQEDPEAKFLHEKEKKRKRNVQIGQASAEELNDLNKTLKKK